MEFPQQLRTPRLLFARFDHRDRDEFLRMRNHPLVTRALGTAQTGQAATVFDAHAGHWERHGYGWWAVRDPESGDFLGCGGLQSAVVDGAREIEIAYGFLPQFWGHGYASELVRVAVAQGFVRLGARELVSLVVAANTASRRVVEKSGFHCERQVIHAARPHLLYRLTARSWCVAPRAHESRTRAAGALQAV